VGFLILMNLTFQLVIRVRPGVLGFSSSISAQEVVNLTNEERAAHGLPPLKVNGKLALAAAAKGQDMIAGNYWAHISPSGVDPWSFIRRAGYDYRFAGENLAKDFGDSTSVVRAWMNSPSHRANILSDRFDEIGVAVLDGSLGGYRTTLVVQMFGLPRAAAPLAQAETTRPLAPSPLPSPAAEPNLVSVSGVEDQGVVELKPPTPLAPSRAARALIDGFVIVRSASISLLFLLLGIVGLDIVLVSRRRIARVGSHSLAHAIMLAVVLVAVWYTQVGVIL
jgi:hypothetical protein